MGASPRPGMLTSTANYFLNLGLPTRKLQVGPDWTTRFINRHKQLFKRRQTPLAAARKNAHSPEDTAAWFERFRDACREVGVQIQDIYNFDETGFRIRCGRGHTVVTLHKKQIRLIDAENRDYITSVECVSANG